MLRIRVLAADPATWRRPRSTGSGAVAGPRSRGLFGQVSALCVKADFHRPPVGDRRHQARGGRFEFFANRNREQLAEEILAEAEAVDAA